MNNLQTVQSSDTGVNELLVPVITIISDDSLKKYSWTTGFVTSQGIAMTMYGLKQM
jgi:hypothetical protein